MADIDESNYREVAQQAIRKLEEEGLFVAYLVFQRIISLYEKELERVKGEAACVAALT